MRLPSSNGQRVRRYADRADAGRRLAAALARHSRADRVIAGVPRGGVVVAFEVARTLQLPLDVIVVRKIGVPMQRELALGAVAEGGVRIVNGAIQRLAGLTDDEVDKHAERELAEVERRARLYREGRRAVPVEGKTVVVVDDGVATGATCHAGCESARRSGAKAVVLALPVGAAESIGELARVADGVVCLETPAAFSSVGEWYVDFAQTTDAEVVALLARAQRSDRNGGAK